MQQPFRPLKPNWFTNTTPNQLFLSRSLSGISSNTKHVDSPRCPRRAHSSGYSVRRDRHIHHSRRSTSTSARNPSLSLFICIIFHICRLSLIVLYGGRSASFFRFHFYGHDMTRQVEAHHFCAHQNEEMRQCLIYDGTDSDARLIGLEYIISENLFLTLPDDEKRLWHSHEYEVKGGVLFMPGVPCPMQRQDLLKVCKTYGKVFHFWQVDRGDPLPLGIPQVMMALTRDEQLCDNLAQGNVDTHTHRRMIWWGTSWETC